MATLRNGRSRPRPPSEPMPGACTGAPLMIATTRAQRAGLETHADWKQTGIGTMVRRFGATGLAASAPFILAIPIEIAIVCRIGAPEGGTP